MRCLHSLLNLLHYLHIYYSLPLLAIIKAFLKSIFSKGYTEQLCYQHLREHKEWAKAAFRYLRVRLLRARGSAQFMGERNNAFRGRRGVILANHRSQADFFIHNILTKFQSNFLSRMAVLLACPLFITSYKTVWFFNRNSKTTPDKFNAWLTQKFEASPRTLLLAYPEGHRLHTSTPPSTLRTGILRYTYRSGLPCQILISFGNEGVLNQKKLGISFGESIVYSFSQIIEPAQYQNETQFVDAVVAKFQDEFAKVWQVWETVRGQRGREGEEEGEGQVCEIDGLKQADIQDQMNIVEEIQEKRRKHRIEKNIIEL